MPEIQYHVNVNLFEALPYTKNAIVIPHVCNNVGGWGAGFVVPLGKVFPNARASYLEWAKNDFDPVSGRWFTLGECQVVPVSDASEQRGPIYVINMIAQAGIISENNPRPLSYSALAKCLDFVETFHLNILDDSPNAEIEIHAPKFGAGLAGGDWNVIELLIKDSWSMDSINIYSLE